MVPRAIVLAALASLLAAPLVAAQASQVDPNPVLTLTVTPAAGTVNPGGSTSYQLSVSLSMAQPLVCTAAASADVTLEAADKPSSLAGLTGTLAKTTVTFTVAGQAGPQPNGFTGAAQTVQFNVTASPNVTPNHPHAFNFTAKFDGSIDGCSPLSSTQIPSRSVSKEATLQIGGSSTSGSGTGNGTGTDSGTDGTGSEAAPHLGVASLALVLAFAARRKLAK
ncbi:MAG: hypothetical protein QOD77_2078 [Thermoplasmata archaeon]|jgi:hypothetical protein|nr:hypothetical protein [Thermoplasmata archaeon]